jgi:hypothetical protein
LTYIDTKARAIVALGLVEVTHRDPDGHLAALVDGEHGTYEVIRRATGVWSCSCPAWTWRLECSHQLAVRLIARTGHGTPPLAA